MPSFFQLIWGEWTGPNDNSCCMIFNSMGSIQFCWCICRTINELWYTLYEPCRVGMDLRVHWKRGKWLWIDLKKVISIIIQSWMPLRVLLKNLSQFFHPNQGSKGKKAVHAHPCIWLILIFSQPNCATVIIVHISIMCTLTILTYKSQFTIIFTCFSHLTK